jgi:polar amino acid transport system substrate-binding protein
MYGLAMARTVATRTLLRSPRPGHRLEEITMRAGVLLVGLTIFALGLAATATGGPSAPAAIPGCAKASLNLVKEGQLSLATDNPAFPPWWEGGSKTKDWEINDPSTGKGYESAVAYGIAKRLGFTKKQVTWQAVPFTKSFAPGKKSFDFYLAQVSNYPERRKAVTFSTSYYAVNQAVAGLKTNAITKVRTLNGLKQYRLGAALGTTSYNYIVKFIQPDLEPRVYDTVNDAVTALKTKQIDGLVTDFPSMGYITNVQVPGSTVVGRLPNQGAQEHFGAVFQKGNPLVRCVDKAIRQMRQDGSLKRLEVRWLGQTGAPILK